MLSCCALLLSLCSPGALISQLSKLMLLAACRLASQSSRSSIAVKGYSSGNSASVASPSYFAEYEVHGPDFTHLTAIALFAAVK